ncbi:uncharacterized protein LOC117662169 isoform X2 [Pantherophis guttatus]|uniref:Uncharacterized protein LOC117662169 isoform X2 n=1 Tax=Pantherophis guttatus TaxID=94885 RepID=A0A6P9BGK2_PANGU|nr:uncharacterized protein LOC117662169 isoform X2 [Pantherophis guttatus]
MDAFGLVPMLTLLHIVLQVSSSAEPLTRPTLSVQPMYQEYYEGEKIRLVCSTFQNLTGMRNLMVQGYRFFRENGQQIHQEAPNAYGDGVMDFEAQMNKTGSYRCAYWLEEAGREVQSDQSRTSSIQVNGVRWIRLLAVGGSFFTINGLIFLISYCISLKSRSLLQKTERTI